MFGYIYKTTKMMKTLISQGWVRGRIKKDLKGE